MKNNEARNFIAQKMFDKWQKENRAFIEKTFLDWFYNKGAFNDMTNMTVDPKKMIEITPEDLKGLKLTLKIND